ncbi:alpha-mannosidase mngB [Enterobacter cancerogenus]|uniref:Alpha-mannosidase mngB n=1 Tax=Enterobacter cancerogenus TaxID=69218 RepID=A0A484XYZ8_9ENTR|nr:alpha-mannosidase mngB [Enterobacter cancerogenus]
MKEFQVVGTKQAAIALTLFKSTGVLGRSNLEWRPGRASGINNTVVETPDAQLLKPLHFSFSVALADNAEHLTLRQLENQACGQPFTYQRQSLHTLDNRLERFQLRHPSASSGGMFIAVVAGATHSLCAAHARTLSGTIVRVFNAGTQPVPVPENLAGLLQINYLEEPVPPVTLIAPSCTCDFLLEV